MGLNQELPESLTSEGSGVELCPEGRGECQALAGEEEADPLESVVPYSREGTGGHLCSKSLSAVP